MKKKIRNWLYYSMKGFEKFHFTPQHLIWPKVILK